MKHYVLHSISKYISDFIAIKYIKRVSNNTIMIEFNSKEIIYFDLSKGSSTIYKKTEHISAIKDYIAPFDVVLKKRFSNSKIDKVYLKNNDKILAIDVVSKSSYKREITTILMEFTGSYTNIIIVDENMVVLEALRHIDEQKSSRVVEVGRVLEDLPKKDFEFKSGDIDCVEGYLYGEYIQKEQKQLKSLKSSKLKILSKQINSISNILDRLEDENELKSLANQTYQEATIILNNIHQIKPYQESFDTYDYDGNSISIKLDGVSNVALYANNLFKKAKRYKQKAKNLHIERDNLIQKLEFLNRLKRLSQEASSVDKLEFLLPKRQKNQTKTKKAKPYQEFFIDGYKIMVGRDERENIYLLQNSKASDFWFHIKDKNSCHVIVKNTKKTIPQKIIELSAKLCVEFSSDFGGRFEVDYTQRRNIKIQNRANVLYNPYSTVVVNI
jgi:predicted ribosome quality control (RQC) complex YloA/Tae2 family protein